MTEWKDIPGWEGLYSASKDGRVRSYDKAVRCGNGGLAVRKGRELKPVLKKRRYGTYLAVTLADGLRRKQYFIHDLIALTFIGPKPAGLQTRHLNDDKNNNRYDNLKYGTSRENAADRDRNGRTARGTAHGCAKLSEKQVRRIKSSRASCKDLSRVMNISETNVHAIRNSKIWRHL